MRCRAGTSNWLQWGCEVSYLEDAKWTTMRLPMTVTAGLSAHEVLKERKPTNHLRSLYTRFRGFNPASFHEFAYFSSIHPASLCTVGQSRRGDQVVNPGPPLSSLRQRASGSQTLFGGRNL